MSKFLPWAAGAAAVIVAGAGIGAAIMSNNSSNQSHSGNSPEVPEEEIDMSVCRGVVDFADEALEAVVQDQLRGRISPDEPVTCEEILQLETLIAPARAITKLGGIRYASNLRDIDLTDNFLVTEETDDLGELGSLRYVNLTRAYAPPSPDHVLANADFAHIQELYLSDNEFIDISWLSGYSSLGLITLEHAAVSDITPLLPLVEDGRLHTALLSRNPLDLSEGSEQLAVIKTLEENDVAVEWDKMDISLSVGAADARSIVVEAPGNATLKALASLESIEDARIVSVDFYEVMETGGLSVFHSDGEAPYNVSVSFDEEDIGKTFHYAAEVITNDGATKQLPSTEYVSIRVEETPECRINADCNDGNVCTINSCVNNECQQRNNPGCADTEISCNDQFDNDQDGQLDCADLECVENPICIENELNCSDGIDNDEDGSPDCDDADCYEDPACVEEPAPLDLACYPLTIRCQNHFIGNQVVGKSCALVMNNPSCSISVAGCDESGDCWGDEAFGACPGLRDLLINSPAGTNMSGQAGDWTIPADGMCGSVNLCRRILLCAR